VVKQGVIIKEEEWDYKPIALYNPPPLDFNKKIEVYSIQCEDKKSNIVDCSKKYYSLMEDILR